MENSSLDCFSFQNTHLLPWAERSFSTESKKKINASSHPPSPAERKPSYPHMLQRPPQEPLEDWKQAFKADEAGSVFLRNFGCKK